MPLYEYHCHKCGPFEIIMDSNLITESYICPGCSQQAKRSFSPPAFCSVFSGTRHALHKRVNQSFEPPRVMNKTEKDLVLGGGHAGCDHKHHHKQEQHGKYVPDRPWMMKH